MKEKRKLATERDMCKSGELKSEQARQRGSVPRLFIFVVTVLTPATT